MKGINHRSLLQNWDTVLHKLCEECSVYDVLSIVSENLKNDLKKIKSLSLNDEKIIKAIEKISEAMMLLNPEDS